MPMKSQAQRAYLHANHPKLAREFEAKTPKNANLPERVTPAPRRSSGGGKGKR